MDYALNFRVIWANGDRLVGGLALGLVLAIAAIAIGTAVGLACAFAATGGPRALRRAPERAGCLCS